MSRALYIYIKINISNSIQESGGGGVVRDENLRGERKEGLFFSCKIFKINLAREREESERKKMLLNGIKFEFFENESLSLSCSILVKIHWLI